jgi:prepilin-type N-terminal cleavage/methylation domain-containing protein
MKPVKRPVHYNDPELPSAGSEASTIGHKGFTLVEVLMCIAILSIVFGTLYQTFDTFNRAYTTENVVAGVQQKTRNGVEFMVHDIRLAGLDPLGTAGAGFMDAESTRIRFTADANFDGDVNDSFENISYGLNGDLLEQTNHLGTEILLDRVTVLTFSYLDEDDNDLIDNTLVPPQVPAAQLADIKTVVISLSTQRPAGRDDPVSRTYTTRVRCRNQ